MQPNDEPKKEPPIWGPFLFNPPYANRVITNDARERASSEFKSTRNCFDQLSFDYTWRVTLLQTCQMFFGSEEDQ